MQSQRLDRTKEDRIDGLADDVDIGGAALFKDGLHERGRNPHFVHGIQLLQPSLGKTVRFKHRATDVVGVARGKQGTGRRGEGGRLPGSRFAMAHLNHDVAVGALSLVDQSPQHSLVL